MNRLNVFWGLDWEAVPEHLNHPIRQADIAIGCVDTRAMRVVSARQTAGSRSEHDYVIDLGNSESSGQFVLGEPPNAVNRRSRSRLRTAMELFPVLTDSSLDGDGQPSCRAVESLERQHVYINQALAYHALALLSRMFRYGTINYHGGFLNLETGQCVPLQPDPRAWRRIRKGKSRENRSAFISRHTREASKSAANS